MNKAYISIDRHESLLEIFEKIQGPHLSGGRVYLYAKKGNQALSKYFGLRMLLARFPGIQFYLVSPDKSAKKFCKSLGIKHFEKVRDIEFEDFFSQKNLMVSNFSVGEYIRYSLQKRSSKLFFFFRKRISRTANVYKVHYSSWYILFAGLFVSICLIGFIFYFSIPRTTVILTPQDFVRPVQANLVYAEDAETHSTNKYFVPVKRIRHSIEHEFSFAVSDFNPDDISRASGILQIINEDTTPYQLVPGTRFQTPEGQIYRTQGWIDVPPGTPDDPGIDEVEVLAEVFDVSGKFIGSSGNIITGTRLIAPGLDDELQEKLYAVVPTDFTGGSDQVELVFTQAEYDKLLEIFLEKMRLIAQDQVNQKIAETFVQQEYSLIPIPESILLTESVISTTAEVGEAVSEVGFTGVGTYDAFLYHVPTVRRHLTTALKVHILEGVEEIQDLSDADPEIVYTFDRENEPFYLKASTSLPAKLRYSVKTDQEFLGLLAGEILNLDKKIATRTLVNHPYISEVSIKISPFWRGKVSNDTSKISFRIRK